MIALVWYVWFNKMHPGGLFKLLCVYPENKLSITQERKCQACLEPTVKPCTSVSPFPHFILPRKGILVVHCWGFSRLHLRELLKAFKDAMFSHGWKINGVIHEKENASVSRKVWKQQCKLDSTCSSHPFNFAWITLLIALFSYSLPLHYTADEMNKSQQKCESLWV